MRTCGACTECCFAIDTWATKPEFVSPAFERCPYQCKEGCSIYAERPQPCRDYSCLWLEGMGERRDRPDRLGLVFERAPAEAGPAFVVTEAKPGAADRSRGRMLIEAAAKASPVWVTRFLNTKPPEFYGEAEEVRRLQAGGIEAIAKSKLVTPAKPPS